MTRSSLIPLDQSVIDGCSTTQKEFDTWIDILIARLGPSAMAAARRNFSLSHVSHIGRCALILRAFSGVNGFDKVIGPIRRRKPLSLYEPRGEWFHLHVAYLLRTLGEKGLKLEQKVNGTPKDIWLRNGHLLVECKSFDFGAAVREIFSSQNPTLGPEDDERTFTHRCRLLGLAGMSPPIGVSRSYSFDVNAIEEKRRQMVPGRCNVLAFNPDPFGRDARALRPRLLNVLQEDANKIISAFLVVGRGPDSDETRKSRSFWFDVDLVCNPTAIVAVPGPLVDQLEGRGIIILR